MRVEFSNTSREEYEKIKKEINSRFKFARIKRNNQKYALGGFSINPKDYENGFNNQQIDSLCIFLESLGYDDSSLNVKSQEIYSTDKGKFTGTKIKYMIFQNGFSFLMKLKGGF